MADETGRKQPTRRRGSGKPWKPGQSGNPAGRPAGSGLSAQLRAVVTKDMPEILAAVVANAKAGDAAAARLLVDRLWPALRSEAMPVELPGLDRGTLTERVEAVLAAAGRGEVSLDTATAAVAAVGSLARIRETEELEARMAAIEKRLEDKK